MKDTNFYLLILVIILLMCNCKDDSKTYKDTLSCSQLPFPRSVVSISPSKTKGVIYIGLANGDIAIKNMRTGSQSTIKVDSTEIYDVYEYQKDSILLVGCRNQGLKLIKKNANGRDSIITYKISEKGVNYGVYSIAFDSIQHQFFLGTSNGCYTLDEKNLSGQDNLKPFILNSSQHSGVNKILYKDSSLYIASDFGLFISKNGEIKDTLFKKQQVYNIESDKDTVYALLKDSIAAFSITKPIPVKVKEGKYYSYKKNGKNEWLLANRSLTYSNDEEECSYSFPDGINPRWKQVSFMDEHYYYLAYKSELYVFPLYQSTSEQKNIIAVTDANDDHCAFFITNNNDQFYIYEFNFKNSSCRKKWDISGKRIEGNVIKFIEAEKGMFFLATNNSLFRIEKGSQQCIINYDDSVRKEDILSMLYAKDELFIGTRRSLFVIKESKNNNQLITCPIDVAETEKDDLYVNSMVSDRAGNLYALTLNNGLFCKEKDSTTFRKFFSIEKYGVPQNMAVNNNLYIQISNAVYEYTGKDSLIALKLDCTNLNAIVSKDNHDFLFLYGNGFLCENITNLSKNSITETIIAQDIPFDAQKVALSDKGILLGSRYGLFLYKHDHSNKIQPIKVSVPKKDLYTIIMIFIIILGGVIIVLILRLCYIKKNARKLKTEKTEIESRNKEEIESRNKELYTKIKELEDLSACVAGIKKENQNLKDRESSSSKQIVTLKKQIETFTELVIEKPLLEQKNKLYQLEQKEFDTEQAKQKISTIHALIDKISPVRKGVGYSEINSYLEEISSIDKQIEELGNEIKNTKAKEIIKQMKKSYQENNDDQLKNACDEFKEKYGKKLENIFEYPNTEKLYIITLHYIKGIKPREIHEKLKKWLQKDNRMDNEDIGRYKYVLKQILKKDPSIRNHYLINLLYLS